MESSENNSLDNNFEEANKRDLLVEKILTKLTENIRYRSQLAGAVSDNVKKIMTEEGLDPAGKDFNLYLSIFGEVASELRNRLSDKRLHEKSDNKSPKQQDLF